MASLLSYGAGASEGLDNFLHRMLVEQQLKSAQSEKDRQFGLDQSQFEETKRRNLSDEGLRRDTLNENTKIREGAAAETSLKNKQTNEDRDAVQALRRISLRPIGSQVPFDSQEQEIKTGVPRELYEKHDIPNMGMEKETGEEVPPSEGGGKWTGTEDQNIKLRAIKDPVETSAQKHTVLYKGKPVDADYDPKARTLMYRGKDITNEAEHYEKPPAPDHVLIQSGSGYETRADAVAKLKAGEKVPLATTSSTRTMKEGAEMLQPHIARLEKSAEDLDKRGLFGPVMSRVRTALTKVGTLDAFQAAVASDPELSKDRAAGQFATSIGLLATGAGRVHGGARGGASTQMLEHFKSLLSDASTLQMFLGRLDSLDEYMSGYAAGPGEVTDQPAKGGGSGLPEVGGTFQGGKVLKVTPLTK